MRLLEHLGLLSDRAERLAERLSLDQIYDVVESASRSFEDGNVERSYVLFNAAIDVMARSTDVSSLDKRFPILGYVKVGSDISEYVIARDYGFDGSEMRDTLTKEIRSLRYGHERALSWIPRTVR